MKNLILIFTAMLSLIFSNALSAQPINKETTSDVELTSNNNGEEEAILTNFKATKTEKKVIKKVRKYVTPKILKGVKHTAALEGKTVTVQMSLNQDGSIRNLQVVEGFESTLDERVIALIRKYDSVKPLVNSKLDRPTIIQMEIPLVGKKRYMR